jgi:hypothetical protein
MAKQHKKPADDAATASGGAVTILVEKQADQRFIAGMFRRELDAGEIEIEVCITASGITGTAQRMLLEQPERRVALVPNAKTQDAKTVEEEFVAPIHRMLAGFPATAWCLAVAIPRLDAWARADHRVAAAFDEAAAKGRASYKDLSLRFEELTRTTPFDRAAASAAFPEFRALAEFIALGFASSHKAKRASMTEQAAGPAAAKGPGAAKS